MPEPARVDPPSIPSPVLFGVFVLSGLSALLYQMIWQRALLTLYGSNVESVAMVVSAFMVGLGLGSLAGGRLSRSPRVPLVFLFAAAELGIGVYGLISLQLFRWVGELTVRAGALQTGVLAFALVLCPTLLMGATLPLLVAHQVNSVRMVGKVGELALFREHTRRGIWCISRRVRRARQVRAVRLDAFGGCAQRPCRADHFRLLAHGDEGQKCARPAWFRFGHSSRQRSNDVSGAGRIANARPDVAPRPDDCGCLWDSWR